MEGISDIKIIGVDEKRPPRIRKEPYIDLFFKLSHKPPLDWSKDFKELMANHPSKAKVDEKNGLFINAWVRSPDEITAFLDLLKEKVEQCSRQYIERIESSVRNTGEANESMKSEESGEQGRLNKIIAGLRFDNPDK
ncbi:MAG: hypothetical protein ACWGOV_09875 [Acidiferrobacterales bacterium]